jgi:histidine kinase
MTSELCGYRVVEQLYSSQRSVVERAIRLRDGAAVVVKRSARSVVSAEALRRAQHEHDLITALRGDGVVACHELVRDGAAVALVLADAGEALSTVLARRRLSLAEAVAAGRDIARILAHVHAAGVVHKDVNPNNLAYDEATRAVTLIDFDIAVRNLASQTDTGAAPSVLEGTLAYMAPEQTGRLDRRIDARTDLYALGITLFRLLTGRTPFEGDDPLAVVHAHLATEPPRVDTLDPSIPTFLGDLVAKLLAKAPERRYQTAAGVAADLARCADALAGTTELALFPLATADTSTRFELPDRLYGRAAEVRALLDAFARATSGGVETVLVGGYSGIGKSSVVREIYTSVSAQGGWIGSGKFEQLHRDVPYSAVTAALDELLAQVLAGGDSSLARWRDELAAAVGDDAALVMTMLPALTRVIGTPPTSVALDADTAQRRLAAALARLVQRLARPAHPLVLFLDDMQWADAASLQLLTQLATSEDTRALLLVEAYRDNEVDPAHPFAHALREHERRGARLQRLALEPLSLRDTIELVGDAMRRPHAAVADAARVIWTKTEGNPFFLYQFLQSLHDDGHLVIDPSVGGFTIDASVLEQTGVTANVAELLARKLGRLPADTREVLQIAAAIGNRFDLAMLATVAQREPAAVERVLAPALDGGMITAHGPRYAFHHDRVQRAAYELVSPEARTQIHAAIGRILLATPELVDDRLFDIVHHLNTGIEHVVLPAERARLVELDLAAARRARRAGAFDVAVGMLRTAAGLVDPTAHYARWFEVRLELAQVLAFSGQPDAARETLHAILPHATPRDRATIEAQDTRICIQLAKMGDAVACTRRAAALLGIDLPTDPAELGRQIEAELGVIMAAMAGSPIERWIDRPAMTDTEKLAVMELFVNCIPAAYQSEPPLLALVSAKLVTLSLEHGICGNTALGYVSLSLVLWVLGHYEPGYQFAKLGVDLNRRCGAHASEPFVDFLSAAFATPWRQPLDTSIESLRRTITRGVECGDIAHSGYAAMFHLAYRQIKGAPLGEILDDSRRYRKLAVRLGLPEIEAWFRIFPGHVRTWAGDAPVPGDDEIDTDTMTESLAAAGPAVSRSVLVMLRSLGIERRYWQGDLAGACEHGRLIARDLAAVPGMVYNAEARFYYCLAAIAHSGPDLVPEVEGFRADLARYAASCPQNFLHHSALVEAELARARDDVATAMAQYDAAIESAAAQGFLKVEALANELAGRFWISRGKPGFAAGYYTRARDLYAHWGARMKVRELEVKRRSLGGTEHASTHSRNVATSTLDFATIVKASNALASEIVLDTLLVKIVDMIVENTGAQAGSIVLEADSGGELLVQAVKDELGPARVSGRVGLDAATGLSPAIVKFATRTAAPVVIGDATRHPTFRSDPYVQERRPRSVLCLPIRNKERVIGAIYLENNLVANAFAMDRLEALDIIVAQLAIAIENAAMFTRLGAYRDHLEELVADRTRDLTLANHQLREQAIVRERMESELRLAQKLQSVGQLAAGVAHEINTPIQFVGNSLEFLGDAFESLLALVGTYRLEQPEASEAVSAALEAADLDYVVGAAPAAFARARDGVERVTKIVGAMKAFSHPDQQSQAPTDLHRAIENTLAVAISEYRCVADVVLDLEEIPDVVCHPGEVKQVLLNLVVNAAHAIGDVVAPTGSRGTITIGARPGPGDTVEISITDTGGGIPAEIRERIFDPFFTTKPVGRGTGQGLSLARTAIVDRHGGTLDFESTLGAGTTFRVRLPVHGKPAAPELALAS